MDEPTAIEVQQAISNGPTGKAGGPTHTTNEMIKHLGVLSQELFTVSALKSLLDQGVQVHGSVA